MTAAGLRVLHQKGYGKLSENGTARVAMFLGYVASANADAVAAQGAFCDSRVVSGTSLLHGRNSHILGLCEASWLALRTPFAQWVSWLLEPDSLPASGTSAWNAGLDRPFVLLPEGMVSRASPKEIQRRLVDGSVEGEGQLPLLSWWCQRAYAQAVLDIVSVAKETLPHTTPFDVLAQAMACGKDFQDLPCLSMARGKKLAAERQGWVGGEIPKDNILWFEIEPLAAVS